MEMVDSVDDLKSSSSVRGIQMPSFEVLDARMASALNRIIHNSHFKRRISLEEQKTPKEDRFLRGRQIACLIYEYFQLTGANDSVENYADLFTIGLRNDDIQEFGSKWDGILLSMTKIPPDDILEGLYKLRIRESEKLKTVLELYDLEIHQKKLGPDYYRLRNMVKRSIEQEIRNKNFGTRSGNYEKNAVVKNQGTKQRVQRILGDQDPAHIDFSVPCRAQYLHSAWKKHQDEVYWVDIDLAIRKGLTFYQTRSNAIILQGTLPAYCIPKVVRLKTGEVLYEKSYMSPRPPPKISLRHDHDWTSGKVSLGCTVDQQPEGKVVRQSRGEVQHASFSQLTQPKPKPICDRSGQPEDMQDVFVVKGEKSRSHEINEKGFHRELCFSDRSGQPDITPSVIKARNLSENTRVEQTHDGSGQPDERNSSTAHTVKEQHAPEVHRDIASFNTDNEFNS